MLFNPLGMMSGIHLREDWEKSTKSVRLAIVKKRGEAEEMIRKKRRLKAR